MKIIAAFSVLAMVVSLGALALPQQQTAPATNMHRYSATGGLVVSITDHHENKLHIYSISQDDEQLQLEATIDLTQAGQERIPFTAPEE